MEIMPNTLEFLGGIFLVLIAIFIIAMIITGIQESIRERDRGIEKRIVYTIRQQHLLDKQSLYTDIKKLEKRVKTLEERKE